MSDFRDLRQEYGQQALHQNSVDADPFVQCGQWLDEASSIPDYQAMVLSTVNAHGKPSARVVLLKQYSAEDGFVWFTDRRSRKGEDIANNPNACLLFYWGALHRQIRIEGQVSHLSDTEAEQYFGSRPLESRLSAAASEQSQRIDSRASLEKRVQQLRDDHPDGDIPRPTQWGGYRLNPNILNIGKDAMAVYTIELPIH